MRADLFIFSSGNAKSRQNAKTLIENGNVIIDGVKIIKPSADINEDTEHTVEITHKPKFVSRGGEKLDCALEAFRIDVSGLSCIDIGASTGGFTDCMLKRGAKKVYAVDAGHSQLDRSLSENEKVVSIEKYNARFMSEEDFPERFDIAVMDVSFISQTLIHKGVYSVLKDGGFFVSLIKPQFECGRQALNAKGIIKKTSYHAQAIARVLDSALVCGFDCIDLVRSSIEGGDGNTEFLALFQKSSEPKNYISENKIKAVTQQK